MLPASTGRAQPRDSTRGRPDGRTVEIQRLIGRSLRAVIDLDALGERTVYLDCDVLEADGGTRCAAITGAYVALKLALDELVERGDARERAAARLGRGGVVRGRRRAARARPRLPRGLDRRGRHERRDDRRGRAGRGAGDRRGRRVLARVARPAARAGGARASRSCARAQDEAVGAPAAERALVTTLEPCRFVLATRNRHKLRELGALLARTGSSRCPDEVELPPETGTTFAENALIKAARPRRGHRQAGARRRLRHRGRGARRRARHPLGPLRGRAARPTSRTSRSCSTRCAARRIARAAYVCALALRRAGRRRTQVFEGRCEGRLIDDAARRRAASATTRSSSRTTIGGRRAHDGRAVAGREGRDQPPRPRRARAARVARLERMSDGAPAPRRRRGRSGVPRL